MTKNFKMKYQMLWNLLSAYKQRDDAITEKTTTK